MPKSLSIYRNEICKQRCLEQYAEMFAQWPQPFEQLWVQTKFGKTHVLANGQADAPPVILLHGQWASAVSWSKVVAVLSKGYRTYAIDQINDVGLSELEKPITGRRDYVDWLEEVLTHLHLDEFAVIGLSYGGYLATIVALNSPNKVIRLLLICPGLPVLGKPTQKWALHGIPMTIAPTKAAAIWLIEAMTVNGYDEGDAEERLLVESVVGLRKRVPIRPEIEAGELRKLEMPIDLLIGEKEAMYSATEAVENAKRLMPKISVHVFKNAGHMLLKDQEEPVLQVIKEVLSRKK